MAGFMIAAPGSGSGKTMITCGLLDLLKGKGYNPFAYKCGPDYIDGLFHRRILEVEGSNLDSYFEEPDHLREKYRRCAEKHLPVVEGVMGYFDGLGGDTLKASSWEIAHILDIPVVLAVDARGASLSLAAVVKGFIEFEQCRGRQIRAVIFNRMSPMLYPRIREAVERETGIQAAGFVPELDFLKVGSRHLGLVLPEEVPGLKDQMRRLGECLEKTVDWKFLVELGRQEGRPCEKTAGNGAIGMKEKDGLVPSFRLSIAMDEAFCFYYQDNLKLLETLGAELVPFSPIRDRNLPEETDGILFGGGYPELYAKELSANKAMGTAVREAAKKGLPILGECGGYLYLLDELEDLEGHFWPMAGIFRGKGYRKGKNGRFGYIQIHTEKEGLYLRPEEAIRGHEFHYWDCAVPEDELVMMAQKPAGNRSWPCIRTEKNTLAGFPHLYYPSCPSFAARFAQTCISYRQKRNEAES